MRTAFLGLIGFQVTLILYKNHSIYYAYYAKNILLALHFKLKRVGGGEEQSRQLILKYSKRQKQFFTHASIADMHGCWPSSLCRNKTSALQETENTSPGAGSVTQDGTLSTATPLPNPKEGHLTPWSLLFLQAGGRASSLSLPNMSYICCPVVLLATS